jgi:hypothetical protein
LPGSVREQREREQAARREELSGPRPGSVLSGSFVNAVNSSRPIVNTLNARLPNVVLLSVVSARSVNAVNNASAASGPSVNAPPRC